MVLSRLLSLDSRPWHIVVVSGDLAKVAVRNLMSAYLNVMDQPSNHLPSLNHSFSSENIRKDWASQSQTAHESAENTSSTQRASSICESRWWKYVCCIFLYFFLFIMSCCVWNNFTQAGGSLYTATSRMHANTGSCVVFLLMWTRGSADIMDILVNTTVLSFPFWLKSAASSKLLVFFFFFLC